MVKCFKHINRNHLFKINKKKKKNGKHGRIYYEIILADQLPFIDYDSNSTYVIIFLDLDVSNDNKEAITHNCSDIFLQC